LRKPIDLILLSFSQTEKEHERSKEEKGRLGEKKKEVK
jgi:hypothetical protein